MSADRVHSFHEAFRGSFSSALRWPQLDALWDRVREAPDDWYVYHVGESPPQYPLSQRQLRDFLVEIDALLRNEHDEDYCGIVYADSHERPNMIKVYDPSNLGMVCGSSESPPLPGWVLSRARPIDLPAAQMPTGTRRRWWSRIFS